MSVRIAVLGATGVYGRHLVPRLIAAGYRVRALVRRPDTAAIAAAAILTLVTLVLVMPRTAVGAAPPVIESKFELFVTNVEESVRFYTTLGFEIARQKPDGYTTLKSGSTVVALSPVPSWLPLRWFGFLRRPPIGTEIVFYVNRLEELRAALDTAGYNPGPIKLQPWGNRDFRATDYDGYYVRVSEGQAVPQ
jgi:catechol 2,3-dioxygenase-like lactoylglutathione lyase family enzyme